MLPEVRLAISERRRIDSEEEAATPTQNGLLEESFRLPSISVDVDLGGSGKQVKTNEKREEGRQGGAYLVRHPDLSFALSDESVLLLQEITQVEAGVRTDSLRNSGFRSSASDVDLRKARRQNSARCSLETQLTSPSS